MASAVVRHFWRVVGSIVVVLYFAGAIASHNREQAWGKWVYEAVRPMHTTLCLWQNWGMFAPAPTSSSWVHFTGITADEEEIPLEPLYTRLDPDFFRWRYDRLNKLVMSGFGKKRKALRRALAEYYCFQAEKEGVTLARVRIERERHWPRSPKRARNGMGTHRAPVTTELGTLKCR